LADVKSAIKFHIETFGPEQIDLDPPILEAFIAEAGVPVWCQSFLLSSNSKSY